MKNTKVNAVIIDNQNNLHFYSKIKLGENGAITIKGKSYETNQKYFVIKNGITTYLYNENDNMPLTPSFQKGDYKSPGEYNKALNEQVLGKLLDVLRGFNVNVSQLITIIVGLVSLVILGLMIYFYSDLVKQIQAISGV